MKIVAPSFSSRFYSSLTHPFHLVDGSPYPLLMSLAILGFAVSVVSWLTGFSTGYLGFAPIALIILISFLWFRDIIREAAGGYHTSAVQRGLLIGFLLFLVSEIMLFFSFFWAYLNSSLSPGVEIGSTWPYFIIYSFIDYIYHELFFEYSLPGCSYTGVYFMGKVYKDWVHIPKVTIPPFHPFSTLSTDKPSVEVTSIKGKSFSIPYLIYLVFNLLVVLLLLLWLL